LDEEASISGIGTDLAVDDFERFRHIVFLGVARRQQGAGNAEQRNDPANPKRTTRVSGEAGSATTCAGRRAHWAPDSYHRAPTVAAQSRSVNPDPVEAIARTRFGVGPS